MKSNVIITFLSILLVFTLVIATLTVFAVEGDGNMNEIPYIAHDLSIAEQNYDGTVTSYNGQAGIDAGVPSGFSGQVLRIAPKTDGGHAGVCVDFSDQNIPVSSVESLTFRIYIPTGGASEFRIMNNLKASSWVVRATPSSFGSWVDVVLTDTSGFMSGYSLDTLADANGKLGAFCVIFRLKSPSESCAYLDSINVKYKSSASDDKTPPVISYNGPTELAAKEGEKFTLEGISAYDEYDNASAVISYEWSTGALDGAGALKEGTHTCTLKATDRSGNVATLELTIIAKADPSLIRLESIPHVPHSTEIADSVYDGKVTELTESQAQDRGVPSGYKGSVYEIAYGSGKSYIGVCLDFSNYNIPINLVESISFNILMPTAYSELRMRNGNTDDWVMRCASAPTGAWTSVVMNADGLNFFGSSNMSTLANSDGNLGSFCLIGRNGGTYSPYYIDSIVIKLKANDNTGPVLTYSGKTDILTSAEKVFAPDITAYDEQENRYLPLNFDWTEGALDTDGKMLEGEHVCVISATDYYGNTSSITLNITVGPKDVTAPTINFTAKEIHVPVGTFDKMVITCVDDYDEVDVDVKWSDGAIDFGGRLNKGAHTLTLTATDLTGNKTVMVVMVYVTEADEVIGSLIECGK